MGHYLPKLINICINKPFYEDWAFWLTITSIFLIVLTIIETKKLRKESQLQNKLNKQPYLSFEFNANNPANYIVANRSSNMAFNIFVLLKDNNRFKILKDGLIMTAMAPGLSREIERGSYIELDKAAVLTKIKSIERLVERLEDKNENYQCIIYEDVFGNKIYSVFYVSSATLDYDKFSEIGYFSNLKAINH